MVLRNEIPALGFGTYGRRGDDGIAAIRTALETGYRHLDTAQGYDTEREVGEAVRQSGLPRAEVFITTKISSSNCSRGKVLSSLEQSAKTLGVDQLDLTLIHWPVDGHGKLPMGEYLPELVEAQERGLTRLIGVSNFTIALMEEAEWLIGPGRLATNQVERHPLLQNQKLVDWCGGKGVVVTCYLPIAHGRCAGVPEMEAIAKAHGATPHQIALAWSLQDGLVVIPTSGNADRIRENFAAGAITLTEEERQVIRGLDRGERQIDPAWGPKWD